MTFKFKNKYSFEERVKSSTKIIDKYPNRIPIICEKDKSSDLGELKNNRFLVAKDLTFGQFMYVIRKNFNLTPEKALYLTLNNIMPPTSLRINSVYNEYKSEDGFLYVIYYGENTFG